MVGISSYLAKPSVALFAIAMNSSTYQQTETSKAIISSTNWNVLDFSDIEKSLASKLSDNDIDKILRSIDAVNNLLILKLAGCVNISGSGLDTLRFSVAIEQIDLSLVWKHESPLLDPEPLLLQTEVLPILDDIIIRGRGSSLKQLELPKKWRIVESSAEMEQFIERYNDYLASKNYRCSVCEQSCDEEEGEEEENEWMVSSHEGKSFGTQRYTCSQCLNHFCYDWDCRDKEGKLCNHWCGKCEKQYCSSCVTAIRTCFRCQYQFCKECCTNMKDCEGGCSKGLCESCLAIPDYPDYKKEKCVLCRRRGSYL